MDLMLGCYSFPNGFLEKRQQGYEEVPLLHKNEQGRGARSLTSDAQPRWRTQLDDPALRHPLGSLPGQTSKAGERVLTVASNRLRCVLTALISGNFGGDLSRAEEVHSVGKSGKGNGWQQVASTFKRGRQSEGPVAP
jgi:hypothetical protein